MSLPPGFHSVNPYVVVADAAGFIAFLERVFGGSETGDRELRTDGAINHANVLIGDSVVMVSQADETFGARPCVNFAYVSDVDDTHARAIGVGARSLHPPTDQTWGDRVGGFVDPFDNRWWVATRTRDGG